MTRAFGYLRVSGKGVSGKLDSDSFPRQRAAVEKFAASEGIEIVGWYQEEAVSGKTEWEHREAWVRMMLDTGDVATVVIEKLDRLARDLMVQEHIIADLRRRGIRLISAHEPDLCCDDPGRKLMRQIMGAIAEYDRAMIVLKLRGARDRMKAKTGRCEGRKPYGETPAEAEVLQLMQEMQTDMNAREIAAELNAKGYETRYGKQWIGVTVAKILRRHDAVGSSSVLAEKGR